MKGKTSRKKFDPKIYLTKAGEGRTILKFRPGEVVLAQGNHAEAVFYVIEGKVTLTVVSKAGKEAVIAILGKGELFGQNVLAGELRSAITVTAMTHCSIMRLDQSTLVRALRREPRLSEFLVAYLVRRGIRMQDDLIDQLFNSSERRLARALLLLANFGQQDMPEAVVSGISQETLAEMVGTTRARVSTFMNKFRRLGFVEYNGGIRVHHSLLNVVLHE